MISVSLCRTLPTNFRRIMFRQSYTTSCAASNILTRLTSIIGTLSQQIFSSIAIVRLLFVTLEWQALFQSTTVMGLGATLARRPPLSRILRGRSQLLRRSSVLMFVRESTGLLRSLHSWTMTRKLILGPLVVSWPSSSATPTSIARASQRKSTSFREILVSHFRHSLEMMASQR